MANMAANVAGGMASGMQISRVCASHVLLPWALVLEVA